MAITLPYGLGDVSASQAIGVGGALTGLVGGFTAASGAQAAGQAQSQGYEANAEIQAENAALARQVVARNTQQFNYTANALRGRQAAAYAAGGVTGAGSALDVAADTEGQIRQQARNLYYSGELQANQAIKQSQFDLQEAKAARDAADTTSTSDIIGGIGQAAGLAAKLFAF